MDDVALTPTTAPLFRSDEAEVKPGRRSPVSRLSVSPTAGKGIGSIKSIGRPGKTSTAVILVEGVL